MDLLDTPASHAFNIALGMLAWSAHPCNIQHGPRCIEVYAAFTRISRSVKDTLLHTKAKPLGKLHRSQISRNRIKMYTGGGILRDWDVRGGIAAGST